MQRMTKKTAVALFASFFLLIVVVWFASFDLAFGKDQSSPDPIRSEPVSSYKLPLPKVKVIFYHLFSQLLLSVFNLT